MPRLLAVAALFATSAALAVPVRVLGRAELSASHAIAPRGVTVSGRLHDDDGEPIAGGDVSVEVGRLGPRLVTTDADGAFETLITDADLALAGAPPLATRVRYGGSALWSATTASLDLAPQPVAVTLQVVVLPRVFAWADRGTESPRALVTARTEAGPLADAVLELELGAQRLVRRTDTDGRAVFHGLVAPAPGVHEVLVRHPGSFRTAPVDVRRPLEVTRDASLEAAVHDTGSGTLEVSGVLRLTPSAAPAGRVVLTLDDRTVAELAPEADGAFHASIALAEYGALHGVSSAVAAARYEPAPGETAATAALGSHTIPEPTSRPLDWAPLGIGVVAAAWLGWQRRPRTATVPDTPRVAPARVSAPIPTLVAPPDGLIGVVVDALTSRPLAGVHVTHRALTGDDAATERRTDADGRFIVRASPVASELVFDLAGYASHRLPLSADARGVLPRLTLTPHRLEALRAYERVLARFGLARRFGAETPRDLAAPLSRAARRDARAATAAFERAYFGAPPDPAAASRDARDALERVETPAP